MIRRILVVSIVGSVCAALFLPTLAWNFHLLMSGNFNSFLWLPDVCWRGVLQHKSAWELYLLLLAVVILLLFWAVASSSYVKYRSKMFTVQPGLTKEQRIEIPMPDGQGQFGTAWWLPRKNMKRRYQTVRIRKDAALQRLLQMGENDYEEVKKANVTLD